MNRPLGEVLADILAETGCTPKLAAMNSKQAASPHIKTEHDCWIWYCEVIVGSAKRGGIERLCGKGATPDEATADCYRIILGADRSDWRDKTQTWR